MKELFNKLSNLFSFGKEHRLVNEGDVPTSEPETVQAGQETEEAVNVNQSPEDKKNVAKTEAGKAVEAGGEQLIVAERAKKVDEFHDSVDDLVDEKKSLNARAHEYLSALTKGEWTNEQFESAVSKVTRALNEYERGADPSTVGGILRNATRYDKIMRVDTKVADKGLVKVLKKELGERGKTEGRTAVADAGHETMGPFEGFDLGEPDAVADAGEKKEDIDFEKMEPMDLSDKPTAVAAAEKDKKKEDTMQASIPTKSPRP